MNRPQRGHAARRNLNTPDYWDMTHERWDREGTFDVITQQRRDGPWPVVWRLLPETGQLLEVGCSVGFFLAYLQDDRRPKLELTGIDISSRAIDFARARVPEATFYAGDGRKLPFSDQSFDVVYSGHFIEHMVDPVPALQEQHRVLRAGGLVIVHFPHGDAPYPEHVHDNVRFIDVEEWLRLAGFSNTEFADVIEGPAVDEGVMWATA